MRSGTNSKFGGDDMDDIEINFDILILGEIKDLSWSANQVDLRKRNQNTKGRKFNRKLLDFQYYKLTQYIKYKAALAGIKQSQVSEACTSQYCSKCFQKGTRKIQGLFTCISCNVKSENADRNAAFNVAQRDLDYMSRLGYV